MVCRLLDVPRSTFLYRSQSAIDLEGLTRTVQHLRVTFPWSGYVWMYHLLRRHGLACSRADVRRVYANLGILGKRPSPRKGGTTDSRHEHPRYPNRVRDLKPVRPDHVWVADTTELLVGGRRTFLALVEDVGTRRTLGFALSFSNDTSLTMEALEMALSQGVPEIHHSDQGKTYASERYTRRLLELGVILSMARVGCAWENGYVERLNRSFKEQEILRSEYETMREARTSIAAYVKLYNEERPHMSLGRKTPREAYEAYLKQPESGE